MVAICGYCHSTCSSNLFMLYIMSLSFKNLEKPSNRKWKAIADYLLYIGLPAINAFFLAVQPVSMEFSLWGAAISNLIIALFKGVSKFSAE